MGALSSSPELRNNKNGLEPIFSPRKFTPMIIVARSTCAKLTKVITGASHSFSRRIKTRPSTQCHALHNRKLPSCPSQKQLSKYFVSSDRLLCCHAYLYSKKWWLMI